VASWPSSLFEPDPDVPAAKPADPIASDVPVPELRSAIAERLGPSRFNLWFGEGVMLGVDGDSLRVDVPNRFFRDWIQTHFAKSLLEAAEAVAGRSLKLDVSIQDEGPAELRDVPPPGPSPTETSLPATPAAPPTPTVPPRPIAERPRVAPPTVTPRASRRLDDFITGPGNRLAHAAVLEMLQSLGTSFNPLVIHGGIGLGKTHLLEGLALALRIRQPSWTIHHLTAEAFTNAFLEAMRGGTLSAFRARFRNADALLMDDIHFLSSKRATQDEFLHTFNALASSNRPVVLTADQHPRLISRLTDELATRFLGGMVVRLEVADPATRAAILRAKAHARGVQLPEPVVAFISDHLRSSVRELEGALHSLIAYATMTGKRIDLDLARTALRDTIRHTAQAVALKDIERAVCDLFQLDPEALRADSRVRSVAQPRMLAMYLARKHTGTPYSEIGRYFGGRNHSTVIAAEKRVASWIKSERVRGLLPGFESIADVLAALERSLGT
jgi:chromosomal replication initiator protein